MFRKRRARALLWLIRLTIALCVLFHFLSLRMRLPGSKLVEIGQGCVSLLYYYRVPAGYGEFAIRPGIIPFLWPPPIGGAIAPVPILTFTLFILMLVDVNGVIRTTPRGHCKNCGHRIRGLSQPRCPECGRRWGPISKLPAVPIQPARRNVSEDNPSED